jgi:hypothetical protein
MGENQGTAVLNTNNYVANNPMYPFDDGICLQIQVVIFFFVIPYSSLRAAAILVLNSLA